MRHRASIYLFSRDLRIEDNELLRRAAKESKLVYPIFIFTPDQITKNKLANGRATAFMARSLIHLASKIPLAFFVGKTEEVVSKLIASTNAEALYSSIDVSPYAVERNHRLQLVCDKMMIDFVVGMDIFMVRGRILTKPSGACYVKYTPFYKNALRYVSKERVSPAVGISRMEKLAGNGDEMLRKLASGVENPVFIAGRTAAVRALRRFAARKDNYQLTRDRLAASTTSHLSAYLHYGIVGPNEVAHAVSGKNKPAIVRQLLWREFYMYIVWKTHTTYGKRSITIPSHNQVRWAKDPRRFAKWCRGETGCPIVDAGMRELNATGYMQNRARMIVATFLIFHLHLNWTLGELYFARNLVDYDYCNNLGGWMWCAAWEVHSNEFFRPLSMPSQMKRFDPKAEYVKKWVPELSQVEAKHLYDWPANKGSYPRVNYAAPIVSDLRAARHAGIARYRAARS